jgi:hypothetical protein
MKFTKSWKELMNYIGIHHTLMGSKSYSLVVRGDHFIDILSDFEGIGQRIRAYIASTMLYQCTECGEMHEGWPAIAFDAPNNYSELTEDEKKKHVKEKTDDLCVIAYENQTDHFIRAVLFQTVTDSCQNLDYGVWVSVSEKNYNAYRNNELEEDSTFFCFLCTWIPGYESTMAVKCYGVIGNPAHRPEVIPYEDQMDHPFVSDYYNGISKQDAEARIQKALNGE